MILLQPRTVNWECPSCGQQYVSNDNRVITPMHECQALKGIMAPFVESDMVSKTKHIVNERQDYVGSEKGIRYDADGKAVMSISTERKDGSNDLCVFPGTAGIETKQ